MPKKPRQDERQRFLEPPPQDSGNFGWHTNEPFDCFPVMKFQINAEGGKLDCVYDPNVLLTHLFNSLSDIFSLTDSAIEDSAKKEGISIEAMRDKHAQVSYKVTHKYFEHSRKLLEEKIQPKLENALWELGNEILVRISCGVHAICKEDDKEHLASSLDELARSFNRQRKYLWEADGRGRPPKWTRAKLEQKLRSGIKSFKKKRYRSPTLAELADELKTPLATLKSQLQRYGLRYSAYKKDA